MNIALFPASHGGIRTQHDQVAADKLAAHKEMCDSLLIAYRETSTHTQEQVNQFLDCTRMSDIDPASFWWAFGLAIALLAIACAWLAARDSE